MLRWNVGSRHVRAADGHAAEQLITAHRGPSEFRESRCAYGQIEVHQSAHQVDFEADMPPQGRVDLLVDNRTVTRPYRFAGRADSFRGFRLAARTGVRVQHDQVGGIESIEAVRIGQYGHGEVALREGNRHVVSAGEVVGEHIRGCGHCHAIAVVSRQCPPAI